MAGDFRSGEAGMKGIEHIQMSKKEWRRLKRAQWKDVIAQLKRFRFGCAYTPASKTFDDLSELADEITSLISSRRWGH
jgi:hypothetical protein